MIKRILLAIAIPVIMMAQDTELQSVVSHNDLLLTKVKCNNLAITLKQVNDLLDADEFESTIQQVNKILSNNGYPYLARDLEKEAAELLESMEEATQDKTAQESIK